MAGELESHGVSLTLPDAPQERSPVHAAGLVPVIGGLRLRHQLQEPAGNRSQWSLEPRALDVVDVRAPTHVSRGRQEHVAAFATDIQAVPHAPGAVADDDASWALEAEVSAAAAGVDDGRPRQRPMFLLE